MIPSSHNDIERNELIDRLLNEDLDEASRKQLNDLLSSNVEAQKWYVLYLDRDAAIRRHARLLDDDDFALLEVQAALDAQPGHCLDGAGGSEASSESSSDGARSQLDCAPGDASSAPWSGRARGWLRQHLGWVVAASVVFVGITIAMFGQPGSGELASRVTSTDPPQSVATDELAPAHLSGTVGARWAGAKLELPEGEQFRNGERLELVEGLAEIRFQHGARVVVQGPAILQIHDPACVGVSIGRIATTVPRSVSGFTVRTTAADLTGHQTELGAEVEVDGSLATQVYSGEVELQLHDEDVPSGRLQLAGGQGIQVDASTGRVSPLRQPNGLQFVRYLPQHEMLVNLADVVAGGDGLGDGLRKAYHQGVSLVDGRPVDDYGAPAQGDGQYRKAKHMQFVDGVFIPDGRRGAVQVDSIGRLFSDFPPTSGDCWGGAILARRPREEDSLPFIRLEFHGNNYGYVNWLHIASKPEELSPQGHGLIGMHSNCGITFDLHAIRARHPNKKVLRFRALVGNLESKPESYTADAWVIVDGELRYRRREFSREDGPEVIDVSLSDRDRFLALVVTDAGADTAYDWVAFGDPVIEMTNGEVVSDAAFLPSTPATSQNGQAIGTPTTEGGRADRALGGALFEPVLAFLAGNKPDYAGERSVNGKTGRLVMAASRLDLIPLVFQLPTGGEDDRFGLQLESLCCEVAP